MRLRQQAAADRAIAREQRIQEEEQRLLAIAKGEREVEERQAQAKAAVLEAEISTERVWADAYAKRNVPTYVIGAGDGDTPTGGDQEAPLLQQLLAMEYAKRLDYDRVIQK